MTTGFGSQGARKSKFQQIMTAAPVRVAVIIICILWSVPTLGMLVSSFRTPQEINTTGWWTAFYFQRENPEYQTLVERVERSETFAERTQIQLEQAQVALEAGVSEEALAEALAEAEEGAVESDILAALEAELADDVVRAETRAANALVTLEKDRVALAETDIPESFPIFSEGWGNQWTIRNYETVLGADGMGNAFLNSLLVTIPSVVIPITIAAFAAYAFAWLEFPGRDLFFAVVIVSMGVPLHLALIPILRMYVTIDLGGTYLGVWLAHTGFGLPLAIYLIYGYMATIPREIMESAHIDGASPFTAFTRLILPLSIPVIASFAIFQFLWVWNDLLVALVFLGTEEQNAVLTTQLSKLVGSKGQDWEVLTAAAFLTMLVPLFIFFALQRYFVRGMMAGSVKG